VTDHTTASPEMGAPAMGIHPPPVEHDHPPPLQHGAPKGIAVGDVFAYLPYVYRVIEHLPEITAFVAKLRPYITMIVNDAPGLIAEGKALLNEVAPNLVAGLAAPSVKFNVSWVQRALNAASNAGLKVDGQMGPLTHDAIRAYQAANGLEPDSWAGPLTIARLFKQVGDSP
jgi:hypothetical protein